MTPQELERLHETNRLLESTDRMLEIARKMRELEAERGFVSMLLAPTLTIAKALYRGRPVPRSALCDEYRDRLVCWDGTLTDDAVLDVMVLWQADLVAGDIEPVPEPSYLRRRTAA